MEPADQVIVALRRIIRAIDLRSKRLMQEAGLTAPQIVVLKALTGSEPLTVGTVAESVELSQGTVTTILNRLETRGLVKRMRSLRDRRQVLVSLTPLGRDTVDAAPPLLQDHFITAFERLEDWEQDQIVSAFQRVASMMDAQDLRVPMVLNAAEPAE
jgi:DNA-binding MarR family transcriptional regulator